MILKGSENMFFEVLVDGDSDLYLIDENAPVKQYVMLSDYAEPEDVRLFWQESRIESSIFDDPETLSTANSELCFLFLWDGKRIIGALSYTISYEIEAMSLQIDFKVERVSILPKYRGYGFSILLSAKLIKILFNESLIPYFMQNPSKDLVGINFIHSADYASPEGERWSLALNADMEIAFRGFIKDKVIPKLSYEYWGCI